MTRLRTFTVIALIALLLPDWAFGAVSFRSERLIINLPGSERHVVRKGRSARLISEDGRTYRLTLFGCEFRLDDSSELDRKSGIVRAVAKDARTEGLMPTFIGSLKSPRRVDLLTPLPEGFDCNTDRDNLVLIGKAKTYPPDVIGVTVMQYEWDGAHKHVVALTSFGAQMKKQAFTPGQMDGMTNLTVAIAKALVLRVFK